MSRLLILLGLITCLFSCEQDTIIELDYPDQAMVVTAIASDGNPVFVSVYNSLNMVQASSDQKFLTEAEVILTDSDGYSEVLTLQELPEEEIVDALEFVRNTPFVFVSDAIIQEGKTYNIEVKEPNFETCYSSQTIPNKTEVLSAFIDTLSYRLTPNTNFIADVDIYLEFQDPPGPDAYEIFFTKGKITETYNPDPTAAIDTLEDFSFAPVKCDDISRQKDYFTARPSILIVDDLFDGQKKRIKFTTSYTGLQMNLDSIAFIITAGSYVHVRRLSQDYYNFGLSINNDFTPQAYGYLIENETENPLETIEEAILEPRITSNNIQNGYGVFGAITENRVRLEWQ